VDALTFIIVVIKFYIILKDFNNLQKMDTEKPTLALVEKIIGRTG